MEISTRDFGTVSIDPKDIITFDKGLIGFEDNHRFVLLGDPEANETLLWLQSLEEEKLAFVVIQPRFFNPEYKVTLQIDEVSELSGEDEGDFLVYAIVVIPEEVQKMSANLKAPLIINVKNNKGKQIILNDDRYEIKSLILAEN